LLDGLDRQASSAGMSVNTQTEWRVNTCCDFTNNSTDNALLDLATKDLEEQPRCRVPA